MTRVAFDVCGVDRVEIRVDPLNAASVGVPRKLGFAEEATLQVGYVPREVAAELVGDEQAVSLWRVEGGLRVLIAPPDAWIGSPR